MIVSFISKHKMINKGILDFYHNKKILAIEILVESRSPERAIKSK